MADIIARFKGDTSDLDTKVKKASQTLIGMKADCDRVGGAFINLEKNQVDFIRSLGKMETGSKSAKGTVAELTKAFTDMSAVYNRLTDEEKRDEGGKALRKSLDELKVRIKEGKEELKKLDDEIKVDGSLLDQLSGKFGVNIKQLTGWGAALGAGKVALDVMKQAFFASEANLDDWNRTVYASESAWDAFLTSLNTGDISGYLSRIEDIINTAKEAYNELDRLSTQKAINNPAIRAQEAENERMRAMLRTGRYIAPNDGRKASMSEGTLLTEEQKKKIANSLKGGQAKLNGFVRDEIEQTTKSINKLYEEQSKKLGMSEREFRAGTANMSAFDERMQGYANYKQWEQDKKNASALRHQWNYDRSKAIAHGVDPATWDRLEAVSRQKSNPYQQYKAWGVFKDDGELFSQINQLIDQRASLQSQNYSNIAASYKGINRAEGGSPRANTRGTVAKAALLDAASIGAVGGVSVMDYMHGTSINELQNQLREVVKQLNSTDDPQMRWKLMVDADNIKEQITDMQKDPSKLGEIIFPDGFGKKKEKKPKVDGVKTANEFIGGMSSIGAGLESLGFELGEGFGEMIGTLQGVMSVIQGVQSIVAVVQTLTSLNEPTQTALLGTIATNTAVTATRSVLPFHSGGIVHAAQGVFVPGAPNGGMDTVPAMLSPGELVLNRAQQQSLAAQLQSGGIGDLQLETVIDAEQLRVVLNRNSRRRGRGEYLTSRS